MAFFRPFAERLADRYVIAERNRAEVLLEDERQARRTVESVLRIREIEVEELTGVIARDRARVDAETAIASKTITTGQPHE